MTHIQSHYLIQENTMALLPAFHIDFDTIVLEQHQELYIRETPLKIIQAACIHYGATYEGRREAVVQLTGYKRKTPIPICPHKNIYTFPTATSRHASCSWLFYDHIVQQNNHIIHNTRKQKQAHITFKNAQTKKLDTSSHIINRQLERTAHCQALFHEC